MHIAFSCWAAHGVVRDYGAGRNGAEGGCNLFCYVATSYHIHAWSQESERLIASQDTLWLLL